MKREREKSLWITSKSFLVNGIPQNVVSSIFIFDCQFVIENEIEKKKKKRLSEDFFNNYAKFTILSSIIIYTSKLKHEDINF